MKISIPYEGYTLGIEVLFDRGSCLWSAEASEYSDNCFEGLIRVPIMGNSIEEVISKVKDYVRNPLNIV